MAAGPHTESGARPDAGAAGTPCGGSGAPPHIETRGLRKAIGDQRILRGIDLTVFRGETLVLIGRSGEGKSVFLKTVLGLLCPDAGSIRFDGQELCSMGERELGPVRRKIGILFQNGALFDSMTVAENVAFPLWEAGERDREEIGRRVHEALDVVGLAAHKAKMPINLSGGMRKRVALARAIIPRPECVLYDEPTAGLDPVVSDTINRLIRRLQERFCVTSIVVTHDMKSAYHVADRIAYLREGKIFFLGTPDELRASTDPAIRAFIEGRSTEALPAGPGPDSGSVPPLEPGTDLP